MFPSAAARILADLGLEPAGPLADPGRPPPDRMDWASSTRAAVAGRGPSAHLRPRHRNEPTPRPWAAPPRVTVACCRRRLPPLVLRGPSGTGARPGPLRWRRAERRTTLDHPTRPDHATTQHFRAFAGVSGGSESGACPPAASDIGDVLYETGPCAYCCLVSSFAHRTVLARVGALAICGRRNWDPRAARATKCFAAKCVRSRFRKPPSGASRILFA